jgi:methylated-DNA-[protein]-cysteine S-methyltransferase
MLIDTTIETTIDSPIGPLTITTSATGVRSLAWGPPPPRSSTEVTKSDRPGLRADGSAAAAQAILDETLDQLEQYFAGHRTDFTVQLDPHGTEFQQSAWMVLRTIPYGSTISYGQQARALGDPNKARAVGGANGRNPIGIIVPCHRVIGANGSLTGFGGGLDIKAWLLDHERSVLSQR